MIKHLQHQMRYIAAMLLTLCGLSGAWAENYTFTPDQATTGSVATAYVTSEFGFTHNDIGWKFNQWNPKTLQVKTNQGSATGEFYFYNTSAFSGNISKVVCYI
ncbi:MAG: hypothetical protein HUK20_02100, partial [Fibrobacter sp.]|nr:hypothetical protein [Bacteroidaceae bacterium]MCF0223038.1 hypothetical protein [Fibrobacter sp.]